MKDITRLDELGHTNMFSNGVYARTIFMPKGLFIVGKRHLTRHLNVVLTGKATVWIEGEMVQIEAPYVFESLENVRKVLIIDEDMHWMTIHPTELKTEEEIEDEIIQKETLEEVLLDLKQNFLLEGDK